MPPIYEHKLKVSPDAIDAQVHVNNLDYLRWMQKAAVTHSASQGWPAERYREICVGWVLRSHWIEYFQPAFLGDEVSVLTWVADFRKIRSLRKYKIVRSHDSAVLVRAETDWAFIGLEHRVPRRVPPELVESFEIVRDEEVP